MPTFTQTGRLLALSTPLGADVLLLEHFAGTEALSRLFEYRLEALSLTSATWTFDQILGQPVTVALMLPDGSPRYFNGIVNAIARGARVRGALGPDSFDAYRLTVVPKLWLSSRNQKSRTFQQLSVPDILKQVLTGLDVSWQLQGTYEPRDYCVQYRESDFAFASRLMEEEGIYYFFKHANGSHQMVVADTSQGHLDVPGPTTLHFQDVAGGQYDDDRVLTWEKRQEVRSGKVTLWDNCFELVGQSLEATRTESTSVAAGTVTHPLAVASNTTLEVYDFPGRYAQRFDGVAPGGGDRASDVQKIFQDNARTAGIRLQQVSALALQVEATGSVRQLSAGHKFTLDGHHDANGAYVLTEVEHEGSLRGVYTASASGSEEAYNCRFRATPAALPFRPALATPRPTIPGPQTATVVGPSGQELFTDKYGRVKVQFHWDRAGQNDANSSCWVRVGSIWAGKSWGAIHIPRIGQEVIVAFEDGDPDRPIIVGSVYNAENMPPYTLPDNMTQSGIKSRSTLQGTTDTFNELRFEDKKDNEQIYFHAEKNFDRVVENNDTLKVGFEKKDKGDQTIEIFNNQKLTVGAGAGNAEDGSQTISVYKDRTTSIETGNESLTVKKGNRAVTVSEGNESLTVSQGNRTVTVSQGNDDHQVDKGNRTVTVSQGNDTLTVSQGNITIKAAAGKISLEAAQSIELKVGGSTIKIEPAGITCTAGGSTVKIEPASVTVQGPQVKVQGSAQVQVQGAMTQVSGDGMLQLKGGVTMIG